MSSSPSSRVALRYEVERTTPDWTLPEEPMPESHLHDLVVSLLGELLRAWSKRTHFAAQIARNLAVRWDEAHPKVGADPDLCVIAPPVPEGDALESLCTWKPGHTAPVLAIEVVSASHPRKDYEQAPAKYAASGAGELWVFDPKLAGPRAHGGPFRLQLWTRSADGAFERVYAGPGPVYSPAVAGWLFVVAEGERLRIANEETGDTWWMTEEEAERIAKEAERAAKEAERAAKEAERAAKEAALARLAALEAELEAALKAR